MIHLLLCPEVVQIDTSTYLLVERCLRNNNNNKGGGGVL